MIHPLVYWLTAFTVISISFFLSQGRRKALLGNLNILLLSLFVSWAFCFSLGIQSRLTHQPSILETDKAELLLKINSALDIMQKQFLAKNAGIFGHKHTPSPKQPDYKKEAIEILKKNLAQNPSSIDLKTKLVITLESSENSHNQASGRELLEEIIHSPNKQQAELAQALLVVYSKQKIESTQITNLLATVKSELPNGWYQDMCILQLYKQASDWENERAYASQIEKQSFSLFSRLVCLMLFAALICLIGVVVIFVQLFLLPGRNEQKQEDAFFKQGPAWSFKTVYVVFISWLATQLFLGSLAQTLVKQMGLLKSGPLLAAISCTLIYAIGNLPGLFYIYWFYCKKSNIKFQDAVRLKSHIGSLGPLKLIATGFFTWCAAIPIVLVSFLIASKYFGAQGSSNPVISLVLESARSSNCIAIIIFYFTLGVLAPLCEESLFRGFLYNNLRKRFGMAISLFFSAGFFAIAHLDMGALIPLFCLGMLFAFVFERTKSLIPSMVAHGLWNSGTFTLMLALFSN